ncbi:hypothetical protein [Oceanibacterium hippocampi]|uniref:Uncharacterized protein n=1 Tax=Oceanibacterium hippocampi TaxID=745714 RepID=A0A1Y5RLE5_9PROT|nr:hypothetical protein [Oceanibacterium hippocampi]SLN20219.1 hypothetical protein OCH7691_00484 [Oceanibacterium hippocampi]
MATEVYGSLYQQDRDWVAPRGQTRAAHDAARVGDSAEVSRATPENDTVKTATADEFTFGDLIDIINPLQHIPVISSIYRELTGDEIRPVARIIGDGIYGGPIGLAGSVANAMLEEHSGRDVMGHAMALVFDDGALSGTVVAERTPDPARSAEVYQRAQSLALPASADPDPRPLSFHGVSR